MSDYHTAKSYLYSRLDAALSVEVYRQPAPTDATYPFVAYTLESQPDTLHKSGLARSSFEAVVRVVGKGSEGPLESHLDAIRDALDMKRGVVRGVHVQSRKIGMMSPLTHFPSGSNEPTIELGHRFTVSVMGA